MAKKQTFKAPKVATVEGENVDHKHDPYRGFKSGRAVKIRIYQNDGVHDKADPWVCLQLGTLPRVWICRGFDWIIPEDLLPVLQDTAVETFEHVPLRQPDKDGNVWEHREIVKNRFPFQILGPATWEEYEAFREKLAHTGKPVDAA